MTRTPSARVPGAVAAVLLAVAVIGALVLVPPSRPTAVAAPAVAGRVDDLLARMSPDGEVGGMTRAERAAPSPVSGLVTHRTGSVLSGGGSAPEPTGPTTWADGYDGSQRAATAGPLGIPVLRPARDDGSGRTSATTSDVRHQRAGDGADAVARAGETPHAEGGDRPGDHVPTGTPPVAWTSGNARQPIDDGDGTPPGFGLTHPPTSTPEGGTATSRVVDERSGGLQAGTTVANPGATPLSGWTVGWSRPDDQPIGGLRNGAPGQTSTSTSVDDLDWNASAGPGATVALTGSGGAASPDTAHRTR
ncbi:cellulose binding domain-containing protein [Umezawaea sp.]|uniref:cellulose binding domain-containing protein n=1 Tax=Umezawaea sp. TaxID=1955258 RepID=UPI002ED28435